MEVELVAASGVQQTPGLGKLLPHGVELTIDTRQLALGVFVGLPVGKILQLLAHGAVQITLVSAGVVNHRHQVSQPQVFEPVGHHVERSALVRHHQHALSAQQVVAHDVRDRLALARPGRTVNDEPGRRPRQPHGVGLAGVGRRDESFVGGGEILRRVGTRRIGLVGGLVLVGRRFERRVRLEEAAHGSLERLAFDHRFHVANQRLIVDGKQPQHGGGNDQGAATVVRPGCRGEREIAGLRQRRRFEQARRRDMKAFAQPANHRADFLPRLQAAVVKQFLGKRLAGLFQPGHEGRVRHDAIHLVGPAQQFDLRPGTDLKVHRDRHEAHRRQQPPRRRLSRRGSAGKVQQRKAQVQHVGTGVLLVNAGIFGDRPQLSQQGLLLIVRIGRIDAVATLAAGRVGRLVRRRWLGRRRLGPVRRAGSVCWLVRPAGRGDQLDLDRTGSVGTEQVAHDLLPGTVGQFVELRHVDALATVMRSAIHSRSAKQARTQAFDQRSKNSIGLGHARSSARAVGRPPRGRSAPYSAVSRRSVPLPIGGRVSGDYAWRRRGPLEAPRPAAGARVMIVSRSVWQPISRGVVPAGTFEHADGYAVRVAQRSDDVSQHDHGRRPRNAQHFAEHGQPQRRPLDDQHVNRTVR